MVSRHEIGMPTQVLVGAFNQDPSRGLLRDCKTLRNLREPSFEAVLKVVACQQLLGLLDTVSPGLSLGRGLVLYELHSALVMVANTEYAYSHDRCTGGHFTDYLGQKIFPIVNLHNNILA